MNPLTNTSAMFLILPVILAMNQNAPPAIAKTLWISKMHKTMGFSSPHVPREMRKLWLISEFNGDVHNYISGPLRYWYIDDSDLHCCDLHNP